MTPFACRSCGRTGVVPLLDLGSTPLANSLLTADRLDLPEPAFSLELVICPACSLVQITETVPPDILFRDYVYFSSFSDTMVAHTKSLAGEMIAARKLTSLSLVVEAASNDGYLLQWYRAAGIQVLGIEPAANVAAVAEKERGIPSIVDFFSAPLADRLHGEGRRADVFHAHNVLAHVADLNGFVRGIHTVLKDNGIAVIEVPYVRSLVERCEFDTIYHEHLCYFSVTALARLFRRHQLLLQDVRHVGIHGGSLRLFVAPEASGQMPTGAVQAFLKEEQTLGFDRPAYYEPFAAKVMKLKSDLRALLTRLKSDGKRIAAYGASAKGSTLLNFCGIGRETLDFVADRSTVKQGRFTPGTHLPIRPAEALVESMPDYALLLTWNFADEILQQQAEYRRRGGRFIVPVPEVIVVE